MSRGKPIGTTFGNLLQRVIYHYWYHTGENQAIRQQLGHARLPQFVGNIDDEAPYRPEPTAWSAARDRRDDVDVRAVRDRRGEAGAVAGHEHVEVGAEARAGVEDAVADARDLAVEVGDDLGDRRRRAPRPAAPCPGTARPASAGGGRSRSPDRQPTATASTDQIGGRLSAMSDHDRPSSALPYSWPVLVPK